MTDGWLTEYTRLEGVLLRLRAKGVADDEVEDVLTDALDFVWRRMSADEREVLRHRRTKAAQ